MVVNQRSETFRQETYMSELNRRDFLGAAVAVGCGLALFRANSLPEALAQAAAGSGPSTVPHPEQQGAGERAEGTGMSQQSADYVPPGPVTARGKAPGLKSKLIGNQETKTYAVIFGKGDEVMSGLTEFAEKHQLATSHFTAIGAFQRATFGWFDRGRKAYRKLPVNTQVEVLALIGDIGLVNGKPSVHTHAVVGLSDGTTRGGHLLEAYVWPTLELTLTEEPHPLLKQHDPETNLELFNLDASAR